MRGTLAMDPGERLTWQGMLTHPYFEGEDGWTERSPLSENTAPAATRTGPERSSDTSTSSIERKRSSSCAPVTSPTTPKVSERRERRMKENAERLRVETEAQARTRSIRAETKAETGRRESELEAAAREARAARERRERERVRAGGTRARRQGEGGGDGVRVLDLGGGVEAATGKVWRRRLLLS